MTALCTFDPGRWLEKVLTSFHNPTLNSRYVFSLSKKLVLAWQTLSADKYQGPCISNIKIQGDRPCEQCVKNLDDLGSQCSIF